MTLNLPNLGKETSGTAAGATQVMRTMIDEVSLISEDPSEVVLRRENVEALIMKLPVPIVLSGLFLKEQATGEEATSIYTHIHWKKEA